MGPKKNLTLLSAAFLAGFFLIPHWSNAATLSMIPESASLKPGELLTVDVAVQSLGQAINGVSGTLSFPKEILEVLSVSTDSSIISFWAQGPTFSNSNGLVSFEGVVLNPGFTGSSGNVLRMVVRGKNTGSAPLSFTSAALLANDGQGTNVLSGTEGAQFTVVAASSAAPASSSPTPPKTAAPDTGDGAGQTGTAINAGGAGTADTLMPLPAVTSSTHPDQDAWYSVNDATFAWSVPSGTSRVELLLDHSPLSKPFVRYESALTEKHVPDLPAGVSYFHVRYQKNGTWSDTAHFKIQVDTVRPRIHSIEIDNEGTADNPAPLLVFEASDETSGVLYSEVSIDAAPPIRIDPEEETIRLPVQKPGEHAYAVRVYDGALNVISAEGSFSVAPLPTPELMTVDSAVPRGEPFAISGVTEPYSRVIVTLVRRGASSATSVAAIFGALFGESEIPNAYSFETVADGAGHFSLISEAMRPGEYDGRVKAIDARGAESLETEAFTVAVLGAGPVEVGREAISVLSVAVTVLALIVFGALVSAYGWYTALGFRRRFEKEMADMNQDVHRVFTLLQKDLDAHLAELKTTKTKKELVLAERKMLAAMQQNLRDAKQYLKQEVSDIKMQLFPEVKQKKIRKKPGVRSQKKWNEVTGDGSETRDE